MVYTIVVHLYAKEGKEVEEKLRNKLIEASQVYSKDKETVGWHVMQDHQDPRKWCIVERYEHESVSPLFQNYWPLSLVWELLLMLFGNRARSTTWRTRTGRPSTPTSSRSLTRRWICAASTSWTPASRLRSSKA